MNRCPSRGLSLRPIGHKDAPAMFAILSQPLVFRFNDYLPPKTKTEVRSMIQADIELLLKGQGVRFAIIHQHQVIGSCGLYNIAQGCAELGFELHPQHWGKGYMQAAIALLLAEYGRYIDKPLTRIQARVMVENHRSINTLTRAGFKPISAQLYSLALPACALDIGEQLNQAS
ncbi:N-acetyltransferase [Pseudoalteromonas sp. CO325X]|uniref:GNAT family N-acetyltransferase n=1 Tax=Pseudoalteromonas sp. CO325X TaxID=1777262 RepID=UPI001023E785|nr:GNAT family N-acetyltransferase [Pseudoalteromonas sp. CO325X]RZF80247.1 N-acetyltransferase [Pseudoalteromonas sp. CO325X]